MTENPLPDELADDEPGDDLPDDLTDVPVAEAVPQEFDDSIHQEPQA